MSSAVSKSKSTRRPARKSTKKSSSCCKGSGCRSEEPESSSYTSDSSLSYSDSYDSSGSHCYGSCRPRRRRNKGKPGRRSKLSVRSSKAKTRYQTPCNGTKTWRKKPSRRTRRSPSPCDCPSDGSSDCDCSSSCGCSDCDCCSSCSFSSSVLSDSGSSDCCCGTDAKPRRKTRT
ncbi:uncharacterized protein LOC116433614 [Nomia melanderi]|uniref:uncharacterized protein LOC116433614 n=1 Tax=Nomia melanderi TaxID=2448451 RepID=UPI003FCE4650